MYQHQASEATNLCTTDMSVENIEINIAHFGHIYHQPREDDWLMSTGIELLIGRSTREKNVVR